MTWLREEGVRTLSLRERFGSLAKRHDLAAAGNLLIVTMPAVTSFHNDEAVALDQWIRNGNTLLVLTALADRPRWARERDVMDKDLQLLTGIEIELANGREHSPPKPAAAGEEKNADMPAPAPRAAHRAASARELLADATQVLAKPARSTLLANRPHRYLQNVKAAYGFSDYAPRTWNVKVPRDGFLLELAHKSETGEGVLWVLPDGPGTMIVSGFGSLFSNRCARPGRQCPPAREHRRRHGGARGGSWSSMTSTRA